MRLEVLRLLAFGPFEGRSLHFTRAGQLDVVYGPNEAGKSTTRRAVLGLLFGIPERSQDGHSVRGDVRVGGVLRDESGRTLEIVRRKGRKNTLMTPAQEPLDDAVLGKWLAGMDLQTFEQTYGLDYARLRQGGDALSTGKGELGESLFSAATGLTSLHALLGELRAEADGIFLAGGKKPPLNVAVKAYAEAKKRTADFATPPEKWLETQREIEQARAEHTTLAAERAALAQRRTRLDALAAHERERAGAEQRLRELEANLADVRARLATIAPAPELLARSEDIALLQEKLGSHRKARHDQPALAGKLAQLRETAARAAELVRSGATMEQVRAMRLDRPSEALVRKLAAEGDSLRIRIQQSAARAAEAEAVFAQARQRLAELEGGRGGAPLRDALAVAQREGDVTARAAAERRRAATERRSAEARIASLGLEGVSLHAVLELRVPSAESVAKHARAARELADRQRDAAQQEHRLKDECIDGERDLAAVEGAGEVPSEAALADLRAERDAVWAELRKAKSAPSAKDASRYEAAVAAADDLADRLRREASRVSQRAQLEARWKASKQKLESLAITRAAEAAEAAAADRSWVELWAPSKVTPRAPEEMGAWLATFETVCASARRALELEEAATALEAAEQRARAVLREALAHEKENPPPQVPLAQLEEMATRLLAEHDAAAALRRTEEGALRAAEGDKLVATKLREAHLADLAAWERAWQRAVANLAAGESMAPEAALATLDALAAALDPLDEAEDVARRLAGIERDARSFEQAVREVCEACAQDLLDRPTEAACAELARRATRASEDRARREALEQQAATLEAQERTERVAVETLRESVARQAEDLGANAHGAAAASEAIAAQLDDLDERVLRATRRLVSVEAGAERWTESAAADEAAEAQRRLALVKELAERWARARLGAAAVSKLLERYRRENQGPVLERAGALFAKLTLGSFRGLEVGFGESDEPVLLAVRPDDRKLETTALSEGTLDQLYLALRIASLERLAATRGPMPLLLDDVLVHFDDARAAAALGALAELAAHCQVILFTHHARVVEIARTAAPSAVVHELGSPLEIQPAAPP